MRTWEEAMTYLESVLDRHPGSDLIIVRRRVDWLVKISILTPRPDGSGAHYRHIIDSPSCELDKAVDYMVEKVSRWEAVKRATQDHPAAQPETSRTQD